MLFGCTGGGDDGAAPTSATSTTGGAGRPPLSPSTSPPPRLSGPPFQLGVASGDPTTDSVVLWTRLAPEPLAGGGMPDVPVDVEWEVASDERFASVVARGAATARPDAAHTVHVDATGLAVGRPHWYRFRVGGEISPVGLTRTLPAADASSPLRMAVACCQNWQSGGYAALRHIAEEGHDLVVHLGDYIYEGGVVEGAFRPHDGPEVTTLAAYRARYALYASDAGLQAARAAAPWVVVWDDHELENNYAGSPPEQAGRRTAAYRAWWEHQPVRLAPPTGGELAIHRRFEWGRVARLHLLDTRQYRSDQPCGRQFDVGTPCPGVEREEATMTGGEQERWLIDGLARSEAAWDVIAQQTVMAPLELLPGVGVVNLDQWDGYPAARRRLLDTVASRSRGDTVVLSGDIHAAGAADLAHGDGAVVATEFVAPSVSSTFPEEFIDVAERAVAAAPHVRHFDPRRRGYLRCDVDAEGWRSTYLGVDDPLDPDSTVRVTASFTVEPGRPGVRPGPAA